MMRSSRVPIYMTCSSWLLLCLAQFPAPGRYWIEHDFMDNRVWWYLMTSLEIRFLLLTSVLHGECIWLNFSHVRAPSVTYDGSVSFPVMVIKYSDKSNLKKKELIWLPVPGYSPSSWGSRGAGAWSSSVTLQSVNGRKQQMKAFLRSAYCLHFCTLLSLSQGLTPPWVFPPWLYNPHRYALRPISLVSPDWQVDH